MKLKISLIIPLIKVLLFYSVVILYLSALWYWEGIVTGTLLGRTGATKLMRYVGDASLVVLPFLLLKPKFRWTVFILLYFSTLWTLGCMWYFRLWGDLPGASSLFLTSNVSSTLFVSVLALWNYVDFMFFAALLLLTAVYIIWWKKYVRVHVFRRNLALLLAAGALFLFLTGQFISSYVITAHNKAQNMPMTLSRATSYRLKNTVISNIYDLLINGPVIHFIKTASYVPQLISLKKELTPGEKTKIQDFISHSPAPSALSDSLISANQNKNIILIIVESLNAYAINDTLNGHPVAPVMQSLIDRKGSVSALNVISQVSVGCSSDGQLMINTGLHPLYSFPAAMAVGSTNTFPSLTDAFQREDNVVIFADDGKLWNEYNTFHSFGFDKIYIGPDFQHHIDSHGSDGGLFSFASNVIDGLSQPFFLELLTMSMHTPFDDPTIPDSKLPLLSRKAFSDADVDTRYLTLVNYFDRELGNFINRLKQKGILDNTMLIIVSDHCQKVTTNEEKSFDKNTPMALIITNCGISEKIDRTVGEIDVFPTILHLTGASSIDRWRGAGESILSGKVNGAFSPTGIIGTADSITQQRLTNAVEISELIHRTNYFAH